MGIIYWPLKLQYLVFCFGTVSQKIDNYIQRVLKDLDFSELGTHDTEIDRLQELIVASTYKLRLFLMGWCAWKFQTNKALMCGPQQPTLKYKDKTLF